MYVCNDNLFSFLPKLSQTFLYLEAENATDQKFGSKSRLKTLKVYGKPSVLL